MSVELIAGLLVIATVTPCLLVGWSFGRNVFAEQRSTFDRKFQACVAGALIALAAWQTLNRFMNWLLATA